MLFARHARKISIKLSRTEENEGNKSISNITNNIGAKSSIERNFQYTLVVSDNGLAFRKTLISGALTLWVCSS